MLPLGPLAKVHIAPGAPPIRTENAQLVGGITVDIECRDIASY